MSWLLPASMLAASMLALAALPANDGIAATLLASFQPSALPLEEPPNVIASEALPLDEGEGCPTAAAGPELAESPDALVGDCDEMNGLEPPRLDGNQQDKQRPPSPGRD